jgi:hypothetical protein
MAKKSFRHPRPALIGLVGVFDLRNGTMAEVEFAQGELRSAKVCHKQQWRLADSALDLAVLPTVSLPWNSGDLRSHEVRRHRPAHNEVHRSSKFLGHEISPVITCRRFCDRLNLRSREVLQLYWLAWTWQGKLNPLLMSRVFPDN